MAKKTENILLPYENKWVALNPKGDKVITFAKDVKVLTKKLRKLKVAKGDAVMTWVPRFDGWYSP